MLLSLKMKQFYFTICIEGLAFMLHMADIRIWYLFGGAVKCRSLITWRNTISVKHFKIITVCGLSSQNLYLFSICNKYDLRLENSVFFRMFNNIHFRKAIDRNIHNGHQNMLTELIGWKFSFKIFFICFCISVKLPIKNWFYANCKLSLKTVL